MKGEQHDQSNPIMLLKNIFSFNEGKKGLMLGFVIVLVLVGVDFTQTFDSSQLQWKEGVSGKLMRGETLTYGGYSIEVTTFPAPVESAKYKPEPEEPVEPFVALNISKNGSFIGAVALRLAESYITPDGELKVTPNELPAQNAKEWIFESYAPWAVIELDTRGTPSLAVSIQTDKDQYVSSYTTDIVATVNLENTGSADAVNVDMVVDTGLPINRGSLKYHYDRIKIGESITETITFASPILTEQKMFGISANVSGYDVMDIPYMATSIKSISMAAELPVILSLTKSTVGKMYLKDYTIISLSVKNNGRLDAKNVNITDSLPDSFKLLGNQSLHWVVDIPVNEEWNYHYLVRPVEPNKEGIVFPAATAEFEIRSESYSVRSNQPKIVVYGPKIILTKKTDVSEFNPGDTVTVTVVAENTGSTLTRVTITDTLPDKATLIGGSTTFGGFLEATMNVSFKYTLRIDSKEPITLPAAIADYYELGSSGRKISTKSQEVELQLKSAKKTPIPTNATPTPAVTITPAEPTPRITILPPTPEPAVTPPLLEPLNTVYEELSNAYIFLSSKLFGEPQPILSIRKSTVDTMYLKDYTSVSLSVENNGTYDLKNVSITDSLPGGFEFLINQSLYWVVDIPAGWEWQYRYQVRPFEPGKGIIFPAATAGFTINNKSYSTQSNQPRIVVFGPKVVLTKKTDVSFVKPGDTVNVTVIAENTGNAYTKVTVRDSLPDNVTLIGGSTGFEGVLEATRNASFNYILRIDSKKPIIFPAATAEYYEFEAKGRKITTRSQGFEITIKSP
ncbi:MAG: hypothetical protein OIN85_10400 [Candidatus Methanoperedens sp.]|nr:hypothetical protein [Candidatus Methanoperedens sp.]